MGSKGILSRPKLCGFTRRQIRDMAQHPETYGDGIIRLSRYMMLKSGYYKRLIEYFANSGVVNWTIDTEVKEDRMYSADKEKFRRNYIRFTAQVNKFGIENRITDILRRLYIDDVCFAFVSETNIDASIFFLEPRYCVITKIADGNVFEFAVNKSLIHGDYYDCLPEELKEIIRNSDDVSKSNLVTVPYDKSLCLKYYNDFIYAYPPFLCLVMDILLIDDFKELARAKAESDAYKLFFFKIPLNKDSKISLGNNLTTPFVEMLKAITPETMGVSIAPMDLELLETKSTTSDDSDKVEDAVESYYTEAGVSKALISSASSGSELKLSMKADSSDIYRIYRMIESWIALQMKIRGYVYRGYQFRCRILPTTIYDVNDYIDRQIKLAGMSVPNKGELLAANGINTAKMLGNSYCENVFSDVFDSWTVLNTSYTQSVSSEPSESEAGRPEMDESDITSVTEKTRKNDGNDPDNRS